MTAAAPPVSPGEDVLPTLLRLLAEGDPQAAAFLPALCAEMPGTEELCGQLSDLIGTFDFEEAHELLITWKREQNTGDT